MKLSYLYATILLGVFLVMGPLAISAYGQGGTADNKNIIPPKLLKQVSPTYPQEALKKGIKGDVIVNATTDENGNVTATEVVSGDPILAKAAVEAVSQWKYAPYYIDGVAESIKFAVTVRFDLTEDKNEENLNNPKLLQQFPPKYPAEALKKGIMGDVILNATTNEKGDVISAVVVSGDPLLTVAAIEAVKKWKYAPFLVKGVAQKASFKVTVRFNLDKK